MSSQKILKPGYVEQMISSLRNGEIGPYLENAFIVDPVGISLTGIVVGDVPELVMPTPSDVGDNIENVKLIYETYRGLSRVQAADVRFWAYLTHVDYMEYMRARTNPEKITKDTEGYDYVLRHWFLEGGVVRNDLARMWWGAKLTHDDTRMDPYELTELFFLMQDFTRTVFGPSQSGRYKPYLQAVLEFTKEEADLFSSSKQNKVRSLAEKMNALATYKCISYLDKNALKDIFRTLIPDLKEVA